MSEDPRARAVYVISVAAELAGVHPQTLRVYERKGLLEPGRTQGGSRRFSDEDLDRLRHIQALTTAGLNLEGVRRVMELEDEVALLRTELATTRAVYVISVAAELAGVHPQTLRVYERRGLVDPSRTGGGNRRYSQRDIEQLRRIQDLTAAGLNL